ncbi:MAG: heme peroxidase family protein [Myxococcales bacterium]
MSHHGLTVRGLNATRSSSFDGRFGRMFRALQPARFTDDDLSKLAVAMTSAPDLPKDGSDEEESGIPALYTYFAQFIDHDLTFDPASSLQKQNDPDGLVDYRTPAFDLDNVYGRGPSDQPYMYEGEKFLLGKTLTGGEDDAWDLPRNSAIPARALIGDPRNDENALVSQLHGLFLRFHNRFRTENPKLSFAEVQQLVRFHYQYVVLHDFLPRFVHSSVLDGLKTNGRYDARRLDFYHYRKEPFMPVEFSGAAYRMGHSMVRPGYRLNDKTILPTFPPAGQRGGLRGFDAMVPTFGLDWGRFIDIDVRAPGLTRDSEPERRRRLQFAYRIDPALAAPLASLPADVATNPSSLLLRNLMRGVALGLPSGQDVAAAMYAPVLLDREILIGQAVDEPASRLPNIVDISPHFAGNCPLWTYVLAEAAHYKTPQRLPVQGEHFINTPQLGPVGGRIVAEVFLGLMFGDKSSLLRAHPSWVPASGADYALRDFVAYALGREPGCRR